MEFSVLMSVYKNDEKIYLYEAIESVLEKQSVIPNEFVIVKDGILTSELEEVLTYFSCRFPDIIKIIPLEKNGGLGRALKIGLENCKYGLVARMDADDINNYQRFEKQLEAFRKDAGIHLVGSYIGEFFDNPTNIKFTRKVPETNNEIKKMSKRRNPINHVSVMFKKNAVLSSGNYKHLLFLEDYYLWIRMLNENCKLLNLKETLVYVRTGEKMFKRRGNFVYIISWYKLQKKMLKFKITNISDFCINMLNIVVFTFIPSKLKKYIYKWFLREGSQTNIT